MKELVAQFEKTLTEIMTRIIDGAAVTLQRRLGQALKSEIKLVYTRQEAADFLGYKSASSIEKLIQSGALGTHKFTAGDSGAVRIGLHHLLCFLKRHEQQTTAHNRIKFDDFYRYPSDGFEVTEKGLRLAHSADAKKKKGAA